MSFPRSRTAFFIVSQRLILRLESFTLFKIFFYPLRWIRDVINFRKETNKSYKWLSQFFDPTSIKEDFESIFLLKLIETKKINSTNYPGLLNMNPTVISLKNKILLFGRATSFVFSPITNLRGHNYFRTSDSSTGVFDVGVPRLVRNLLFSGYLNSEGDLFDQKIELEESLPPCFEDARAFLWGSRICLIGTWTTAEFDQGNAPVIKQSISIYFEDTKDFLHLKSPFNQTTEKNWIPIEVIGNHLFVLYSSSPFIILKIDLNTGGFSAESNKSLPNQINFHGRSQFLKLKNGNFIRVASKRFPLAKFGLVHFSFIIEHDTNYEPIRISRPFLFKTPGFEICNGICRFRDNEILFSWGENDSDMYFGVCTESILLEWLIKNELTPINFKSKNWKILRSKLNNL